MVGQRGGKDSLSLEGGERGEGALTKVFRISKGNKKD
jgi:hypothetical protein